MTLDDMLRAALDREEAYKSALQRLRDDIRKVDAGDDAEIHAALLRALRTATKALQEIK